MEFSKWWEENRVRFEADEGNEWDAAAAAWNTAQQECAQEIERLREENRLVTEQNAKLNEGLLKSEREIERLDWELLVSRQEGINEGLEKGVRICDTWMNMNLPNCKGMDWDAGAAKAATGVREEIRSLKVRPRRWNDE